MIIIFSEAYCCVTDVNANLAHWDWHWDTLMWQCWWYLDTNSASTGGLRFEIWLCLTICARGET